MKKKTVSTKSIIFNKRAKFDYQIIDEYEAGIVLSGAETKSIRSGRVQLSSTYVTIMNNELYVIGLKISPLIINKTQFTESTSDRTRKLLLKRSEIEKLIVAKNSGLTVIVTAIRTKSRFIKLKIATAKGKKNIDKRQVIKSRDFERQKRRGDYL